MTRQLNRTYFISCNRKNVNFESYFIYKNPIKHKRKGSGAPQALGLPACHNAGFLILILEVFYCVTPGRNIGSYAAVICDPERASIR